MVLGLKEFDFGDIEGGQRGVEVEMESVGIPRLAVGQAGELLGISKEKFYLEPCFVIPVDRQRIQVRVGGKEESIAFLGRVAHIQHDNHAQRAFERDVRLSET